MSSEAPQTPPPPPPSPSPSGGGGQVGGLDQNIAAALGYIPIIAIVWLVLEPYNQNKFIKFHAIQSIGLAVVSMGLSIVLGMIPIIGWIGLIFLPFLIFVVWIVAVVKAFQNETFKLPLIGNFAEEQANK